MPKIYADVRIPGLSARQPIELDFDVDLFRVEVAGLREMISDKLDVDTVPDDLRLCYAGQELQDGKTLENYEVTKQGTLRITVKGEAALLGDVQVGGASAGSSSSAAAAAARPSRTIRVSVKIPGRSEDEPHRERLRTTTTIEELKERIEDARAYPASAQVLLPSCACSVEEVDLPAPRRQRLENGAAAERPGARSTNIGDPLPNSCELGNAGLCSACGGMVLRLANPSGGHGKALSKLIFVEGFRARSAAAEVEAKPVWMPVRGTEAEMFKALEDGLFVGGNLLGRGSGLVVEGDLRHENDNEEDNVSHGEIWFFGI